MSLGAGETRQPAGQGWGCGYPVGPITCLPSGWGGGLPALGETQTSPPSPQPPNGAEGFILGRSLLGASVKGRIGRLKTSEPHDDWGWGMGVGYARRGEVSQSTLGQGWGPHPPPSWGSWA